MRNLGIGDLGRWTLDWVRKRGRTCRGIIEKLLHGRGRINLHFSHDLGYLNKPHYEELTEVVNSTFAPLHGLMKSVKKETGIIGSLMALILSGIIVGLARHYPVL